MFQIKVALHKKYKTIDIFVVINLQQIYMNKQRICA